LLLDEPCRRRLSCRPDRLVHESADIRPIQGTILGVSGLGKHAYTRKYRCRLRPHGGVLPNGWRISCWLSCRRPHKPTFRHVLQGRGARAELGTRPARRRHARVMPHARWTLRAGRPVADILGLTKGGYRFVDG
jgi:hypothetical protein